MNRPFKFRVWDNNEKKFLDYDCYFNHLNFNKFTCFDRWFNTDEEDIVIQQYTGYLDKNKKEIYEGDIVRTYDNHPCALCNLDYYKYTNGVVRYYNAAFHICQMYVGGNEMKHYITCDCCPCGLEVIGNMMETPELEFKN
jgi:uncharacterized phage protein (TIGR01671 family)